MPKKRGRRSRKKRSRRKDNKKYRKKSRKLGKRRMKGAGFMDYMPGFLQAKKKPEEAYKAQQAEGSLPGPDGTCPPQKGLITKAGDFFGKGIGEATGLVGKAGGAITSVTQDVTKKTSGVIKGQLDGLTSQLQKVNKNMFQQAADSGICPCCGQKLPDKKEDLQKDVKQLEINLAGAQKEEVKTDNQMVPAKPDGKPEAKPENVILQIEDKKDEKKDTNDIEEITLDSLASN
jgi:hypothetical protein